LLAAAVRIGAVTSKQPVDILTPVKVSLAISRHCLSPVKISGEHPMCDYSLHAVASRPAKVGETLVTTSFYGTSTRGFGAKEQPNVAVCLLPGTELAFDHDVKYNRYWLSTKNAGFRVAQFCVIEPKVTDQHHDALLFPDGNIILVNLLSEGQYARVLQLPVRRQENANRREENVNARAEEAQVHASHPGIIV
jgi:hypothetical protein